MKGSLTEMKSRLQMNNMHHLSKIRVITKTYWLFAQFPGTSLKQHNRFSASERIQVQAIHYSKQMRVIKHQFIIHLYPTQHHKEAHFRNGSHKALYAAKGVMK